MRYFHQAVCIASGLPRLLARKHSRGARAREFKCNQGKTEGKLAVWENGWEIMAGVVSALLSRLGAHEVCNLDALFGLPPASGGTGGAAAKGTFPHLWLARCHPSFFFFSLPLLQTTAIHSFETFTSCYCCAATCG